MMLRLCFILLSFIPLLPAIFPYSSLSSHHFHYLLSSIINCLIIALQMTMNASPLWESSDGVIQRTELPLWFMILIMSCLQESYCFLQWVLGGGEGG